MLNTRPIYLQNLVTDTTIRSWLDQTALERIDAESLLCYVLQKPRSFLFSHKDNVLNDEEISALRAASVRRENGEPLPYITGVAEFWSMEFTVTPDVLIPRDDTGCLVDVALSLSKTIPTTGAVIDAGTGSGAVAIAYACETGTSVVATDVSVKALQVATRNASRLAPELIDCVQAHWLNSFTPSSIRLLLSNPPYISFNDPHLKAKELQHEPQSALVAGADGLDDLRQLAVAARTVLVTGGAVAFEHGYDQAKAVHNLLHDAGLKDVTTVQDLSGNDRVTYARAR